MPRQKHTSKLLICDRSNRPTMSFQQLQAVTSWSFSPTLFSYSLDFFLPTWCFRPSSSFHYQKACLKSCITAADICRCWRHLCHPRQTYQLMNSSNLRVLLYYKVHSPSVPYLGYIGSLKLFFFPSLLTFSSEIAQCVNKAKFWWLSSLFLYKKQETVCSVVGFRHLLGEPQSNTA